MHIYNNNKLNIAKEYHRDDCFRCNIVFCRGHILCFDALRPKSTAMVMAGRSVHLTTLFPGQA